MNPATTDPARLNGRPIYARPGETLIQALARRGRLLIGRSIRYHRPRAPLCGTGACSQCLVRVNDQPNVRACRYTPAPGDRIRVENSWPGRGIDLLAVLDLLFYRGLDTHHGFRRPRWATPLYHRVVRRLAGFGHLAGPSIGARAAGGASLDTDTVVIGAGVSGRACAERLVSEGHRVHLLDRAAPAGLPPGLELSTGFTAAFLPPPSGVSSRTFTILASREDGAGRMIRASQVVIATGGYDTALLFDGNDRPGVMTAEGAEALTGSAPTPPFRHAVVFGGEERAGDMLDRFGAHVEAVVAPGPVSPSVADRAARLEVPLFPRTLLLSTRGRSRVRAVVLSPRGEGRPFTVGADAVLLAHRRLPNAQLLFQVGARMEWRAGPGGYYPALTNEVETSVPGVFAVGEAAGYVGEGVARKSGEAAAERILGRPSTSPGPRVEADRPGELLGYLRELRPWLLHRRRPVLCPCEDVLLEELEEAHRVGYQGMEVVKRYTGVGTGLCQGRYCLPDALLLLSILEERGPAEVGYTTQRPPVFPAPLDALASLELPPAEVGE